MTSHGAGRPFDDVPVLRYAAFPDGDVGGNPAGVVLEAAGLDDHARSATARSVGCSETAFLDSGWRTTDLDPRHPVHVAYAGNDHLVLAVHDRARPADLHDAYDQLAGLPTASG